MSAGLPRFPPESPVRGMRAVMPLAAGEDGIVVLPGLVLWALGLNEGDLVAAELRREPAVRVSFRGYGERVRRAVEGCSHPWPWVEELLRLPMTAVGPAGALALPEEVAAALAPPAGGSLLLRAWVEQGHRGFSLERQEEPRSFPELWAEARYTLPVEEDFRIALPPDALWALCLAENAFLVPESLHLSYPPDPATRVTLIVRLLQESASFRLEPCPEF